jgi:hypothetical protein
MGHLLKSNKVANKIFVAVETSSPVPHLKKVTGKNSGDIDCNYFIWLLVITTMSFYYHAVHKNFLLPQFANVHKMLVFVLGRIFKPSLMFVGKARSLP